MNRFKPTTWLRATLLAVPVLATQVAITQLQIDTGLHPLAVAVAAEGDKQSERERRKKGKVIKNRNELKKKERNILQYAKIKPLVCTQERRTKK